MSQIHVETGMYHYTDGPQSMGNTGDTRHQVITKVTLR